MSYATDDLTWSPYIASVLHDPVRRPSAMAISLVAAALTLGVGPLFILHQIEQLPPIVSDAAPRPAALPVALAPVTVTKLQVLPADYATAPVVNAAYAYVPTTTAQALSADITAQNATALIETLSTSSAPQVIETTPPVQVAIAEDEPSDDDIYPAYSDQGRLVAVPDEDLTTP